MGNTYARNLVKESAKVMTSIANSATSTCSPQLDQGIMIAINNNKDVNINFGTVETDNTANINIACVQNVNFSNSVTTQLKQAADQMAKAITQQFDLNPGTTEADNVSDLESSIQTSITNIITLNCIPSISQVQGFDFSNNQYSNLNIGSLDLRQNTDAVISCVQNAAVENSVNILDYQTVVQHATAEVQSFLTGLIVLLIVILIIIGVIVFAGVKGVTNPKFLIALAVLIVIYVVLAIFLHWWPFRR